MNGRPALGDEELPAVRIALLNTSVSPRSA
jgi:hypothetical protein